MNSLGRTIEKGELVVVAKDVFTKKLPVRERVFVCDGTGFGCSPGTVGTAVFGRWLDGSGKDRICGSAIDAGETNRLRMKIKCGAQALLVGAVEALAEADGAGLGIETSRRLWDATARIFDGV